MEEGEHIWKKPMEGWVKVNTDAALFQDGSVRVGCVMRDSQGVYWSQMLQKDGRMVTKRG